MKVQFNIKFHTKYGESLWLCGLDHVAEKEPAAGGIPMKYLSYDYWTLELDLDPGALKQPLSYFYTFQTVEGERIPEYQTARELRLPRNPESPLVIYDTWIATDAIENVFYTTPFQEVLFPQSEASSCPVEPGSNYIFIVRAPLLEEHEVVCLLGNTSELSNWNRATPVLLQQSGNDWMAGLTIPSVPFSIEY